MPEYPVIMSQMPVTYNGREAIYLHDFYKDGTRYAVIRYTKVFNHAVETVPFDQVYVKGGG